MPMQTNMDRDSEDLSEIYCNIQPVFFMNSAINGNQVVSEIEVTRSLENIVESSHVDGCQKMQNVWRCYIKTVPSRLTLLQTGIDIRGQHIDLYDYNPASMRNNPRMERPKQIKITVKDIPLSYSNQSIYDMLVANGAKLNSQVKYSTIRDEYGQFTNYKNGDRFVYADQQQLVIRPVPKFILLGSFVARVIYQGQQLESEPCKKCLGTDHPHWKCVNDSVCKVCKLSGHRAGSEECEFYVVSNNCYTFGGRVDPLRLSNFENCNFVYKDREFASREVAFQYHRALIADQPTLAETIYGSDSPQTAKYYSRCLKPTNMWHDMSLKLMTDICLEAATQDATYRRNILATGNRYLAESIMDQYYWATALNHYETKHTRIDKLPGQNKMGVILMNIRDILRNSSQNNTPITAAMPIQSDTTQAEAEAAAVEDATVQSDAISEGAEATIVHDEKTTVDSDTTNAATATTSAQVDDVITTQPTEVPATSDIMDKETETLTPMEPEIETTNKRKSSHLTPNENLNKARCTNIDAENISDIDDNEHELSGNENNSSYTNYIQIKLSGMRRDQTEN